MAALLSAAVQTVAGFLRRGGRRAALALLLAPLVADILRYQYRWFRMRHLPCVRQYIKPFSVLRLLIPVNYFLPYTVKTDYGQIMDRLNTDILFLIYNNGVLVYTRDADHIREITAGHPRDFPKPVFLYRTLECFGLNIVSSPDGPVWQRHRAICNPAFSSANLDLVRTTAAEQTDRLLRAWEARADGQGAVAADVGPAMTALTLAIIAEAGFGQRFSGEAEGPPASDVARMGFETAAAIVADHLLPRLLLPRWAFRLPVPWLRRVGTAFDVFSRTIEGIIASSKEPDAEHRADLLSLMLKANTEAGLAKGHYLSDEEVVGDIFMFLLAGHETTAGALHWTLRLLAAHPDVQQRAAAEVDDVLGGRDGVTATDLDRLEYVRDVFFEGLRLFPAVGGIPKWCPKPTTLGNVPIPAGATVMMDIKDLHRNRKYYDDPTAFRPERFSEKPPGPFAFCPFSYGARSCIGLRFAQIEAVTVLARILQRFTVR
eukprot:EG_transcript_11134